MIALKKMVVPVIGVLMIALGFPTLAQAQCKGMSKSACEKSSQCSYVKGYTTKSGNKISAYCRNKAKKGAASGSTSKTKAKTGDSKSADKKAASANKDAKKKDSKKKDSKKKDAKKKDAKKKDTKKKDSKKHSDKKKDGKK